MRYFYIFLLICVVFAASIFGVNYYLSIDRHPYSYAAWGQPDEYGLHCGHDILVDFLDDTILVVDPANIFPVDISLQNEARNRLNGRTFAKLFPTEIDRFSNIKKKDGYTAYLVQTCFFIQKKHLKNQEYFLELIELQNFRVRYDQQMQAIGTRSLGIAYAGDVPTPYVFVLWHNQPIKIVNPSAFGWN